MQDAESGARDIAAGSQTGDETFDEHRFPASQLALESQSRSGADVLRELLAGRFRFSWAFGNERSHVVEVESF